jgi:hypothetical protein
MVTYTSVQTRQRGSGWPSVWDLGKEEVQAGLQELMAT